MIDFKVTMRAYAAPSDFAQKCKNDPRCDRLHEVAWFQEQPPTVQARILTHPPWYLYHNQCTKQIMQIESYSEDVEDGSCDTCCVVVRPEHQSEMAALMGCIPGGLSVFGVSFDDLQAVGYVTLDDMMGVAED